MVSEEIRAMIPDYVRGLLSPNDAKEVEAALAGFPELSHDFEAARAYYAALNQIPEVRAPADFLDRVNRGIDHTPVWPGVRKFLFEPFYIKLPVEFTVLAACFIIMLMIKNPFIPKEQLYATAPSTPARFDKLAPIPVETKQPAAEQPAPAIAMVEKETKTEKDRSERIVAAAAPAESVDKIKSTEALPALALAKPEPVKEEPPVAKPAPAPAAAAAASETPATAMAYAEAQPRLESPKAKARAAAKEFELPAESMAESAPPQAAAQADEEESIEQIGTIELSYVQPENDEQKKMADANSGGAGSTARIPNPTATAATILNTYDPHFKKTIKNGKVTFICTFAPDRLSALIEELGKPFNVTTQLFPYDARTTKLITVTFVVR